MSQPLQSVEDAAEVLETDRVRRANQLAYAQGRREADVDAHLRSHEKRLNAINGSIEKHAINAAKLGDSIEEVRTMVERIEASLATNAAVEADRVQQVKQANDKQISRHAYWLGVAGLILTGVAIVISILIGTHII
jgi:hypothetical protein